MKEFKIDLRHQLKSFREGLYLLVWNIAAAIVLPFVMKDIDFWPIFVIFVLFWIVTSVGTSLPLHINYLKTNWRTKLIVDSHTKTIRLIKSDQVFDYNFSQIRTTRFILGHYRPDRNKSWTPIPFDYYGYLQIETGDNQIHYLTSLMLDPFNPPLPINKTEYEFPFIWNK
jgi:hypothetical protein